MQPEFLPLSCSNLEAVGVSLAAEDVDYVYGLGNRRAEKEGSTVAGGRLQWV